MVTITCCVLLYANIAIVYRAFKIRLYILKEKEPHVYFRDWSLHNSCLLKKLTEPFMVIIPSTHLWLILKDKVFYRQVRGFHLYVIRIPKKPNNATHTTYDITSTADQYLMYQKKTRNGYNNNSFGWQMKLFLGLSWKLGRRLLYRLRET